MPFDPSSPFDPTDPWRWWQTHILPHILVQPNAPLNAGPGQASNPTSLPNGSLVPAGALEDDGFPNDWFVPEDDGYPNDWIYPDNHNAPAPPAAPRIAPPAPSPQPNPAASNRPPACFDPYAAFWSQIPASRAGAMAWHPPIFLSPDSFSPQNTPSSVRGAPPPAFANPLAQFLPATSALSGLPPGFGTGGILGGIAKLVAEQARANDLWALPANGILGGFAKLAAASAPSDPVSLAATRGLFASLANPIGYQGARNLYSYVGNDPLNREDATGFAADQPAIPTTTPITTPFPLASGSGPNDPGGADDRLERLESQYYGLGQDEGFPTQPSLGVSRPPIRLVNEIESLPEEEKPGDHLKHDPSSALNPFGESNSVAGRIGFGAGTAGTALVPYRPPATSAPQPLPRASLPPPSSRPPAVPSPPSAGRASTSPIGPAPAVGPEGDAGNRGGAGVTRPGLSSPTSIGVGGRAPTSSAPDWQKVTEEIKDALAAGGGRVPAVISTAFPKYDGKTTYGVLITNEGDVVPLQSSERSPLYSNYVPSGHVEGKAALWMRGHGSSGGVVYHNNTDGTCGFCNAQIGTLLPKGIRQWVVPPADAIAKNSKARQGLTYYIGNSEKPKLPPQYDFFWSPP
jgi:hypothetical protein